MTPEIMKPGRAKATILKATWRLLGKYSDYWDQEPALQLIQATAIEQWKLLLLGAISNLCRAALEGASLGTVFLAVDILTQKNGESLNWKAKPILSSNPHIINWVEGLSSSRIFMALILLAVSLKVLQGLMQYVNTLSVGYLTARCNRRIRSLIYRQITSLSFACASGYRVGDLTELASEAPTTVRREIEAINNLLINALMSLAYLAVLIQLSPALLCAAVIIAAAVTLLQKNLLPRIEHAANRITISTVEISSFLTETIQGLRLLHSFGMLNKNNARLDLQLEEQEVAQRRQAHLLGVLSPISETLPLLAISIIAVVSLSAFRDRSSGILPSLVVFVLALQRLNMALSGIAANFTLMSTNSANLNRLNVFISPKEKIFRRTGGIRFSGIKHAIHLENVSLRYPCADSWALRSINITIPHGKTIALVGGSGAGKSSIADLIVGLHEPTEGKILVDNIDLKKINLSSWQRHLGVVSQDTFLFNASIAENISYGCEKVDHTLISAAADRAQLRSFIETLPAGFDTLVGERGYRLSGGQRQRISLARAFLRDPQLLILDEATSALDSSSEHLVQKAINDFNREHTILVIAHRLSTIALADEIIVLDQGLIVERGTHAYLLQKKGHYWEFWVQQTNATTLI